MIEIVFSSLTQKSLKNAQSYGRGDYPGGYAFITYYNEDHTLMTESEADEALKKAEAEEEQAWNDAVPLGGNPDDVFDLSLNLNIGDISELNDLDKRIASLDSYQYDQENYSIGDYERGIHETALTYMNTIIKRIKSGEKARIWYSKTAEETLGAQWLMWNFRAADVPCENLIVNVADSWKSMKAKDWHKFTDMEKPFSKEMLNYMATEWEAHMKENGELRVMECDKVKTAPKDYYDDLILEEAKTLGEEFQESWLMGHVHEVESELTHYWIYTRIEEMIEEGKLLLVKEGDEGWPKSWKIIKVG